MDAWRSAFQKDNSNVTVNYDPSGSGAGVEKFNAGGVDFAASDSSLSADKGEIDAAKKRCGADAIEVPELRQPDRGRLQPEGRDRTCSSPRRRSPRSSTARSPSGTTRRSRPRTRAPSCPRPRSRRCTAPTSRAPRRTSPTTSSRPARVPGATRRTRSGRSRAARAPTAPPAWSPRSARVTARSATPTSARPATSPRSRSRSARRTSRRPPTGAAKALEASPLEDGRPASDLAVKVDRKSTDAGRLPAAAGVVPDRLPDVRRRQDRRQREGLPELHRLDRGPAGGRRQRRLGSAARVAPAEGREDRRHHLVEGLTRHPCPPPSRGPDHPGDAWVIWSSPAPRSVPP